MAENENPFSAAYNPKDDDKNNASANRREAHKTSAFGAKDFELAIGDEDPLEQLENE